MTKKALIGEPFRRSIVVRSDWTGIGGIVQTVRNDPLNVDRRVLPTRPMRQRMSRSSPNPGRSWWLRRYSGLRSARFPFSKTGKLAPSDYFATEMAHLDFYQPAGRTITAIIAPVDRRGLAYSSEPSEVCTTLPCLSTTAELPSESST